MITEVVLDSDLLETKFRPLEKSLSAEAVLVESERCYYCYEAPCVAACPTDIDIPGFIRALAVGQPSRAADCILQANPLGASCSRVCPVETLCEQACVRQHENGGPVPIGQLQKFAMQKFSTRNDLSSNSRTSGTGTKVAVVGAGPAGMTAATLLAQAGFTVDVFESHTMPGGLNESGIAAYKMLDDAAQWEASRVLSHPGIHLHTGMVLGKELHLSQLCEDYAGVLLALGLQGQQKMQIPGEELQGVFSAVPYIARMRRQESVPVGQRVVVIGGGMTAIDIAVQVRLLGAEEVHICYRRGPEAMGASLHEQMLAKEQGVFIHHYLRPVSIAGRDGTCESICLQPTQVVNDQLQDVGDALTWSVDQVFVAIGQQLQAAAWASDTPELAMNLRGKIQVDGEARTSLEGVWAAGDCASMSEDLTVHAVADAKVAVASMIATLAKAARKIA